MTGRFVTVITASDWKTRNISLDECARPLGLPELLAELTELDAFRRSCENLYWRVRALFFLHWLHRFHVPARGVTRPGLIPADAVELFLNRRFDEALTILLGSWRRDGPSLALSTAMGDTYRALGFHTLTSLVRRSVRAFRSNQWMFRMGHAADHPLRVRPELIPQSFDRVPLLRERTPVRVDLTHSGWSDIFFLGMDYPEGAKVINISVDLGVVGRDDRVQPPIESYLRLIDAPTLRLVSADLGHGVEIHHVREVFDFSSDYLGLLKAAVIAAGLVPPGLEGCSQRMSDLLEVLVGPGKGIEITTHVREIPKGSRLAVSTNLLASVIALCMRATGQVKGLTGALSDAERRVVAARAILGEWLGGSGGGWQDSGGLWPGIKLIQGEAARSEADPEFGVSRGRLLPSHQLLGEDQVSTATREALESSLILIHGGMSQNVGPVLEMVTERYLLRSEPHWQSRQESLALLDEILGALRAGDVRKLAATTTKHFFGPLQTIIPWASNAYTETLIDRARAHFGGAFWGFCMLGGMSGGGMGMFFDPARRQDATAWLREHMVLLKRAMERSLPFAIDPVVYAYAVNTAGSVGDLDSAELPQGYETVRQALARDPSIATRTAEGVDDARDVQVQHAGQTPATRASRSSTLRELLEENGFDARQHEQVRASLKEGKVGLAQNRLSPKTSIRDVRAEDVLDGTLPAAELEDLGRKALERGEVGVVTLAGGLGSRWTQGAGVVKALHPFCKLGGRHRSFLEVHLAKSRRTASVFGPSPQHVITTSYLTHEPIVERLGATRNYGYDGPVHVSRGKSVGLRLVPTAADLDFAWNERAQQLLEKEKQKNVDSLRRALIEWVRQVGEASDYKDNLPMQRLHPVGHWYEVPNMLLNGTLVKLLRERPSLRHLLLHNVDTVGADLDPRFLGMHLFHGSALTFEVVPRCFEDRGGGLALVDGRTRLVEEVALPRDDYAWRLSYYNSMTTWIDIDRLLGFFALSRDELEDDARVADAVRAAAARVPTYIVLKDVKKWWGLGQEDVVPVLQFEKLWGDMSAIPEIESRFLVVPRQRGQQLKEPAQLDLWLRDGSKAAVEALCDWPDWPADRERA